MERHTHINRLPDDLLIKIFWPSSQPATSSESASNALCESLCFEQKYIWKCPSYQDSRKNDETATPILVPPPVADAARNLSIAAVCRRWRRLAQRHVTTLLVKNGRVVSRQDLTNAIACFAYLSQLHLCDSSVEIVDDEFLAHLAASCPKLTALHVGNGMMRDISDELSKKLHPVSRAGLAEFFKQCTELEQLSIFGLHPRLKLPESFFRLTRLHTLVLPDTSVLRSSEFTNLSSLACLRITTDFEFQQLSCLVCLPKLTDLAIGETVSIDFGEEGSPNVFSFAQLPHLQSLEVDASVVLLDLMFPSELPCVRLERLVLANWEHPGELPAGFGERFPCLRELTIEWLRLESLPEDFTSLKRLESLTISNCLHFSSLPENFGRLPALKTLVLHMLPLTHVPETLPQLSSLETLIMVGCRRIRELPADFNNLATLKTLCIVKLPHVRLPEAIEGLPIMAALFRDDVFHQLIFPASFTELTSLTRLDVDLFTIDEIPEGIKRMTNLQQLHVHYCPDIKEIPDSVTQLTNLEVLTVGLCTSLASVPKKLDGFTKLKRLELTGCELLTEASNSLPLSLEVLSIGAYKQATSLPDIALLRSIKKLSLNLVDVECGFEIGRSLACLEHLDLLLADESTELAFPWKSVSQLRILKILRAGKIEKLPEDLGSALQQLRQLEIHFAAELRELPVSISQLQRLTSLVVDAPKLTALPDTIGSLSRLRELILTGCSALGSLPDSLTQLACLHRLNAENAAIRFLPSGFSQLTRLRTLTLHHCGQLEELPKDLAELKLLYYLGVYGCTNVLDGDEIVGPIMDGVKVESGSTTGLCGYYHSG